MTMLNINDSLVLIIDIQEKLLNAIFNKALVEKKALTVTQASNILEIPIIITEQYPKGLGETVEMLKKSTSETTLFYEKTAFNALENQELLEKIKNFGRKQIILFGIETHICVNQTASALIAEGFEVYIIKDACGSRTEYEYLAGLERMKDNGVKIITTEIALFEWLKGARHPKFKEVQSLIK